MPSSLIYFLYLVSCLLSHTFGNSNIITLYFVVLFTGLSLIHLNRKVLLYCLLLLGIGVFVNGLIDGIKLFIFVLVAMLSYHSCLRLMASSEIKIWLLLLLIPLLEIVLQTHSFVFGFARELDTEALYYVSNTMELPLLLLVLGITMINSSKNYSYKIFGMLLLLLDIYTFNRRFVVICIVLWILVKCIPRIGIALAKLYAIFLPILWGFMSLGLIWMSTQSATISGLLTKGEGVRNILTASGRVQGWFLGVKYLFAGPIILGSYGELPREWFYTDIDRYHHVHNTLIQTGLDYGMLWSVLLLLVILKLNITHGRKIVLMALLPTESLFMNMHLVAVIILLIMFENAEVKNTPSNFSVKA